jgi:hypothetical protein
MDDKQRNVVDVTNYYGKRYFFKVNDDLTISRSTDCINWEVIDFTGYISMETDEVGTVRNSAELTSVELKNEGNRLIMVTNLGNYIAEGGNVIGDTWIPC